MQNEFSSSYFLTNMKTGQHLFVKSSLLHTGQSAGGYRLVKYTGGAAGGGGGRPHSWGWKLGKWEVAQWGCGASLVQTRPDQTRPVLLPTVISIAQQGRPWTGGGFLFLPSPGYRTHHLSSWMCCSLLLNFTWEGLRWSGLSVMFGWDPSLSLLTARQDKRSHCNYIPGLHCNKTNPTASWTSRESRAVWHCQEWVVTGHLVNIKCQLFRFCFPKIWDNTAETLKTRATNFQIDQYQVAGGLVESCLLSEPAVIQLIFQVTGESAKQGMKTYTSDRPSWQQ